MENYLIEIPHSSDKIECSKAIMVFLNSGSHFLANAEWGCSDGEHKAWLMVNVKDRNEALQIIPQLYRQQAKIIKLEKYTKEKSEEGYKYHNA